MGPLEYRDMPAAARAAALAAIVEDACESWLRSRPAKTARRPAACKRGGARPDAARVKRRNRARAKAARAARRAARA